MHQRSIEKKTPPWSMLPALGWLIFFMLIPLGIVIFYSFLKKDPYGQIIQDLNPFNYLQSFNTLYLRIFYESFKMALITAFSCLLLGYPMAYFLATIQQPWRLRLLLLMIVPFWTNLVIRSYATRSFLGAHGPVNELFLSLGIISEPIAFINSPFGVWLGMVTNYLPFMVLPLFVALEKFDFTMLEAGRDLGATSWKLFWRVLYPLTKVPMAIGFLVVFIPALGEFLIPDLLGGSRTYFWGNLVADQFLKMRNWPLGSALSTILMVLVLIGLLIFIKLQQKMNKEEL